MIFGSWDVIFGVFIMDFLIFGKWKNDDATMVGDGLGGVWIRFVLIWIGSDIKNHGIMKNPNVG